MEERSTIVLAADGSAAMVARHAVRDKGDELGFSDMATAVTELLTTELVLNCLRLAADEITLQVVAARNAGDALIQVAVAPSSIDVPIASDAFPDEVATRSLERYATGWGIEDRPTGRLVSFEIRGDAAA